MNPKLQQYEEGIDKAILPQDRDAYDRIVAAGLKLVTSEQFRNELISTLDKDESELPESIAEGMSRLVYTMHTTSKGTMPVHVTFAAAYVLMAKALHFAEQAMGKKVDDAMLGETALATAGAVAKVFGISSEQLKATAQKNAQGGM